MLRLAHRIMSQGIRANGSDQRHARFSEIAASVIENTVRESEIIIADNVAEYVQAIAKPISGLVTNSGIDELGIEMSDIPNVMPPFDRLFIEWIPVGERDSESHIKQAGVAIRSEPAEEALSSGHVKQHYFDRQVDPFAFVTACHVYSDSSGIPRYDGNCVTFFCNKMGQLADGKTRQVEGSDFYHAPLGIPFMAIAFMHCKNVVRTDATETEGPPDKWLRRMKQPALRYHVLEIDPMKEVLRKEGGAEATGIKKALHICRGHFATYTEEKPLFGNFVGTVWKSAHVRGAIERGAVVKDYSIKAKVS